MKLYRFSPIKSKAQLMKAISHIHFECNKLAINSLGKYFPAAGNVALFCHYEEEFAFLEKLKKEICSLSKPINRKYFKLHEPIVIAAKGQVPKARYTHLYIRKPDPYRSQVGDVDFYLEDAKYQQLKKNLGDGKVIEGARIYLPKEPDMVELFDPDSDVLAYVSNWRIE